MRTAKNWLVAVLITSYGAWLAVLTVGQVTAKADTNQIQSTVTQLQSYATEGSLLTDQIARRRTTYAYAHNYALKLADLTSNGTSDLADDHVEPPLRDRAHQAKAIADQLGGALTDLAAAGNSPAQAQTLTRRFHDLAGRCRQLEGAL